MNISVIICCYNSESRIISTIEKIALLDIGDLLVELIIVDNNSTDNTVGLVQEKWSNLRKPLPLIIVKEINPGLSFARKKGVFTARGEIIIFCDDDNWLDKNYLLKAYKLMCSNPEIGVLGGRGTPVFQHQEPFWFASFQGFYAVGCQGISSGDLTYRGFLWGAGFVLRLSTMKRLYLSGFDSLCSGRKGDTLLSGDDSEICKWHLLIGKKLWYDEDLIYSHYLEDKRLNKDYFLNMIKGFELSKDILDIYDEIIRFRNNYNHNSKIYKIRNRLVLNLKSFILTSKKQKYSNRLQLLDQKKQKKHARNEYFKIITSLNNYFKMYIEI